MLLGALPRAWGLTRAAVCAAARYFAACSCRRCPGTGPWHEVTVHLVDDARSDELHRAILGVPGATDVITQAYDAIPPEPPGLYGELFVNVDQAARAAPRRRTWSPARELLLYIAHGMDHLSGADDHTPSDYARMRRRELRWLARVRVLAALILLSAAPLAAETGPSILDNGAFEKFTGGARVSCWHYASGAWRAIMGGGVDASRALLYAGTGSPARAPWQTAACEVGRAYELSADLRVPEALTPDGAGARVRVAWLAADGRELGHTATSPVAFTGDAWQHVAVRTPPAPAAAARARVTLDVTPSCTGRVFFDNVRLAPWYAPREVALETSVPNATASDGLVELRASWPAANPPPADARAYFTWRGADGRAHTAAPETRHETGAVLTLRVRELPLGTSQIAFVLLHPNGTLDTRREMTFHRTCP